MNAVKIKERQLDLLNLQDWIMEEKFKGIRVWYIKEFGHYRLITRGGEDCTAKFPHITEPDWMPQFDSLQLDCELFDPEQEDEIVSGWANTLVENLDPDKVRNCVLHVFDILHFNDVDLQDCTQIVRKKFLHNIDFNGPLKPVEWLEADRHREYYDYILSKGGEGIMLKNKYALYYEGKRTVKAWFKRKKRDPYDVVIMGYTEGKGKFEGLIGALKVGQFIDGHLTYICNVSGMPDDKRRDFTINGQYYLGRVASVWAMEQDKNSFALIEPSFSHIRVDKRPEECIGGL
jgi:ATP-dependent DNA ligase